MSDWFQEHRKEFVDALHRVFLSKGILDHDAKRFASIAENNLNLYSQGLKDLKDLSQDSMDVLQRMPALRHVLHADLEAMAREKMQHDASAASARKRAAERKAQEEARSAAYYAERLEPRASRNTRPDYSAGHTRDEQTQDEEERADAHDDDYKPGDTDDDEDDEFDANASASSDLEEEEQPMMRVSSARPTQRKRASSSGSRDGSTKMKRGRGLYGMLRDVYMLGDDAHAYTMKITSNRHVLLEKRLAAENSRVDEHTIEHMILEDGSTMRMHSKQDADDASDPDGRDAAVSRMLPLTSTGAGFDFGSPPPSPTARSDALEEEEDVGDVDDTMVQDALNELDRVTFEELEPHVSDPNIVTNDIVHSIAEDALRLLDADVRSGVLDAIIHDSVKGETRRKVLILNGQYISLLTEEEAKQYPNIVGFKRHGGKEIRLSSQPMTTSRYKPEGRSDKAVPIKKEGPSLLEQYISSSPILSSSTMCQDHVRRSASEVEYEHLQRAHPDFVEAYSNIVHANKKIAIREVPDRSKKKDRRPSYTVNYTWHPPGQGGDSVQPRHGQYVDKRVAQLLANWLYTMPHEVKMCNHVTRIFLELLMPAAITNEHLGKRVRFDASTSELLVDDQAVNVDWTHEAVQEFTGIDGVIDDKKPDKSPISLDSGWHQKVSWSDAKWPSVGKLKSAGKKMTFANPYSSARQHHTIVTNAILSELKLPAMDGSGIENKSITDAMPMSVSSHTSNVPMQHPVSSRASPSVAAPSFGVDALVQQEKTEYTVEDLERMYMPSDASVHTAQAPVVTQRDVEDMLGMSPQKDAMAAVASSSPRKTTSNNIGGVEHEQTYDDDDDDEMLLSSISDVALPMMPTALPPASPVDPTILPMPKRAHSPLAPPDPPKKTKREEAREERMAEEQARLFREARERMEAARGS